MSHPSPSLDEVEAVAAKDAIGRRITLSFIKNNIASVHFMIPGDHLAEDLPDDYPLRRMTLCLVTTRAGFVVVGKSAPIDPNNFDIEKGETFAYEDAVKQLWSMFAFADLERQKRAREAESVPIQSGPFAAPGSVQGEGGLA